MGCLFFDNILKEVFEMICTVLGFGSKPYDFRDDDKKQVKGVSHKISVSCGAYPVDHEKGITGEGELCDTFKCNKILIDSVRIGDRVSLEIYYPDGPNSVGTVKSAMLEVQENMFSPIF